MTYRMHIKVGLFALLFAFCLPQINAQQLGQSGVGDKNPELKKELRAYRNSEVKPVMLEKRLAFDQFLSPEDRAAIDEVRKKMQAYRSTQPRGNNQLAPTQEADEISPVPEKKGRRPKAQGKGKFGGKYFREHPEELEQMRAIAERYGPELDDLEKELEPLRQQWKTDIQAIVEKHGDEATQEKIARRRNKQGKKNGRQSKAQIAFLLMPLK